MPLPALCIRRTSSMNTFLCEMQIILVLMPVRNLCMAAFGFLAAGSRVLPMVEGGRQHARILELILHVRTA